MKENREIVLSEQEIQDICNDFGKRLTEELKNEEKTPLFLGVMKGALNFMFDLIKRIDRPIYTDFIQISSYAGVQSTGKINLKKDFDMDIKDRTVVVVEDVVDTGISMKYLIDHLNENYQPKRIIICALFDKEYARCEDIKIDYCGKVLKENSFLVGYGLDYNELERNVPYVYIAKPEDIDRWNEEIQK
ncbi:MAG: hypoxanthine phosphoribosyltransferase [Bacilli bacterium]|jgi:hypoxanthine phosphoribosyltransferase|nr:hypoxanthine phosphoribosyltransferase [Bacilli bacterium]